MNFWDEIWGKYPETRMVYGTEKGRLREHFYQQFLANRKGLTLDLGCGDGHLSPFIENYVGLDISIKALLRFGKPRILGVVEYLPFNHDIFDLVVVCECLEHIKERDKVIGEVYRVLKVGGEVIVSCPYGHEPLHISTTSNPKGMFKRFGIGLMEYLDGRLDEDYLKTLFLHNGLLVKAFKVISIKGVPNNIFMWGVKK